MRRRALLGALGTGLTGFGGCLALSGPSETTTRTQTEPPDETTTRTRMAPKCDSPTPRRVELVETDPVPSDADLSLTATMTREQVTTDAPARLRVRLTNEGSKRAIKVSDSEYCHLFDRVHGRSTPDGLWLYRQADAPGDRVGGCWTRYESPSKTHTFDSAGCGGQTYATGESVTTTYEVWDDYATAGYYEPDTYRFEAGFRLWNTATEEGSADRYIEWGVDLTVTKLE